MSASNSPPLMCVPGCDCAGYLHAAFFSRSPSPVISRPSINSAFSPRSLTLDFSLHSKGRVSNEHNECQESGHKTVTFSRIVIFVPGIRTLNRFGTFPKNLMPGFLTIFFHILKTCHFRISKCQDSWHFARIRDFFAFVGNDTMEGFRSAAVTNMASAADG